MNILEKYNYKVRHRKATQKLEIPRIFKQPITANFVNGFPWACSLCPLHGFASRKVAREHLKNGHK